MNDCSVSQSVQETNFFLFFWLPQRPILSYKHDLTSLKVQARVGVEAAPCVPALWQVKGTFEKDGFDFCPDSSRSQVYGILNEQAGGKKKKKKKQTSVFRDVRRSESPLYSGSLR